MTNTPDLRALVERLERKRDRVHPTNRSAELPMLVKMTFGDLEAILSALTTLQHRVAEMEADQAVFEWLGEQRNLELSFYSPVYGDDDDQSREWRVTQVTASINDREWTTIGCGETPAEALRKARSTLKDRGEG